MSGAGKEDFNFDKMYEELKSAELKKAEATIDDLRGELAQVVAENEKMRLEVGYHKGLYISIDAEVKDKGEAEYKKRYSQDFANAMSESARLKQDKAQLIEWLQEELDSFTTEDGTWLESPSKIDAYEEILKKIEELNGGGE